MQQPLDVVGQVHLRQVPAAVELFVHQRHGVDAAAALQQDLAHGRVGDAAVLHT